jgi:hypothetical protein
MSRNRSASGIALLRDHAKDDWINVERAMAVPLGDVVSQLRESCPNSV